MAGRFGANGRGAVWAACMFALATGLAMPADAAKAGKRAPAATTTPSASAPALRESAHRLDLSDGPLAFRAQAGRIATAGGSEAGFIAYLATGKGDAVRPVTFVLGGGPGTSSAFAHLGALGPWRMAFEGSPSRVPGLQPNPETWLRFTDLVFIDPPGTGSAAAPANSKRDVVWSVDGDRDLIADVIARWLAAQNRRPSAIVIAGQSYGGLRAPRIAERLRAQHELAVRGLVLISPVLDYGWRYQARSSPLPMATLLPSFAATAMEAEGRFSDKDLADVETYAAGNFIADYLRGPQDVAAVERMVRRVTTMTGLPADVVRAAHGRIDEDQFVREFARARGRVLSSYDASISGRDPDSTRPSPGAADPFLAALRAPVAQAMNALLRDTLQAPQAYAVVSEEAFEAWDWGRDGGLPESVTALRRLMALDPKLRILVAHGYQDLQTPYFETKLILDQFGDLAGQRLIRKTYPGGHMFYSRDSSRQSFAREAAEFYAALGAKVAPPNSAVERTTP